MTGLLRASGPPYKDQKIHWAFLLYLADSEMSRKLPQLFLAIAANAAQLDIQPTVGT